MIAKERYSPMIVGVNSTVTVSSEQIGGFLAATTGTISVANAAGVTIVASTPVTAGVYTPIPFYIGLNGGTVTTAGGASGTLAV